MPNRFCLERNESLLNRNAAPTGQLSHKRSDGRGSAVPGPLEIWSARFGDALGKTRTANHLLARLGLLGPGGRWTLQQLRLGYCDSQAFRSGQDKAELKKLGLLGPDGRHRLAGCVTVPYLSPTGAVAGFFGARVKGRGEAQLVTGTGSGLLLTGELEREVVLVDGVLEALTCFGAGLQSLQALDLLTPGWFPVLVQRGVEVVKLLVGDPERARQAARELRRLGLKCVTANVPRDPEYRLDLFQSSESLEQLLKESSSR
jgi:hypothetical protein